MTVHDVREISHSPLPPFDIRDPSSSLRKLPSNIRTVTQNIHTFPYTVVFPPSLSLARGDSLFHIYQPPLSPNAFTPSLVKAVLVQTRRTPPRHRPTTLRHDPTRQTQRPPRIPAPRRDLHAVRDHGIRLRGRVLQLRRARAGGEGVVLVGQVDDRQHCGVAAAEEGGAQVQSVGEEGRDVGDDGHAGEARVLGALVGGVGLGAVGVVGGGVGGVVVDDEHVDQGPVEEGPDGVVLQGFAAVDEVERLLGGDEGGGRVGLEGVGILRVFVGEGRGVDGVEEDGQVLFEREEDVGGAGGGGGVDGGDGGAGFVEEVG